jgi:hypothetical protein
MIRRRFGHRPRTGSQPIERRERLLIVDYLDANFVGPLVAGHCPTRKA